MGQIDISNLEILVNKKKKHSAPEIVFSYKNRIIHSPTLCKSSVLEKSTAAQVQTITGASVPLWESDFESIIWVWKQGQATEITPLISCVQNSGMEDSLNHSYSLFPNSNQTVGPT